MKMHKNLCPHRSESADSKTVDSKTMVQAVVEACAQAKGEDISVLDVANVFDLSDYFVVVSGRSDRQVQGISNRIAAAAEELGLSPLSYEGYDEGHWVLMDYGDVIVHIFYEPYREHYDIEGLWVRAKRLDVVLGKKTEIRELQAA